MRDDDKIDRVVFAHQLVGAGYELRDNFMVQTIGDREIRFKEIAHGVYVFDGEREARIEVSPEQMEFEETHERPYTHGADTKDSRRPLGEFL